MGEARAAEGTEGMSDTIPDAVIEAMAREFYSSHAPNPWRAALAAADKLGWRLCPREPTKEMMLAALPEYDDAGIWYAAWDAAPKVSG